MTTRVLWTPFLKQNEILLVKDENKLNLEISVNIVIIKQNLNHKFSYGLFTSIHDW